MLIAARQRICTAHDAEIGMLLRFMADLEPAHFAGRDASSQYRGTLVVGRGRRQGLLRLVTLYLQHLKQGEIHILCGTIPSQLISTWTLQNSEPVAV